MREIRQQAAVQAYLNHKDGKTIINACPRFGKIKVAIDIMKEKGYKFPLIIAPRTDIEKGWKDDFIQFCYSGTYDFRTFRSLKKKLTLPYDFLIIDEPHELSMQQQRDCKYIVDKLPTLGLTGTMTQNTRKYLYKSLNLDVCFKYTIEQGVREGILADYQIFIHKISLDNSRYTYSTSKKKYTEQGFFNLTEYLAKEAENSRTKHMFELKLISILQNSISKMEKTRQLISLYKDERVLVFCGVTDIADKLGIPVYHSKKREENIFLDFCEGGGQIDQLATIKMMQAGVTISPINKGIINYMSGNPEDSAQKICRFLGMEYNNLDKKAEIHIICTTENFELERLKTGLLFFEEDKIKFI